MLPLRRAVASAGAVCAALVVFASPLTAATAVNISKTSGKSTAPALAAFGPLILAAWEDATPGNTEVVMATSGDGGGTFGAWQNVSQTTGESTCFDWAQQGEYYYFAWSDNTPGNREVFYRRLDVIPPVGMVFANLSASAADSLCPKVELSGGNVYVAWTEDDTVKVRRSTDGGITFKPVLTLGCGPAVADIVAVGPNVHVLTNRARRYSSSDGGATFTTGAACGAVNPGDVEWGYIFAAEPFLYYLFRVKPAPGNTADIFFRREGPVNIPNTLLCHQHATGTDRAGILVSGRFVYAWWNWAANGPGLLYARSADGGVTWTGASDITGGSSFNVGRQRAVLAGRSLYFVWEGTGGANEIMGRASMNAGVTFSGIVNISGTSTNSTTPALLVNGLNILVAWEDTGTSGNKDIYVRRSTTGAFTSFSPVMMPSPSCGG